MRDDWPSFSENLAAKSTPVLTLKLAQAKQLPIPLE